MHNKKCVQKEIREKVIIFQKIFQKDKIYFFFNCYLIYFVICIYYIFFSLHVIPTKLIIIHII